MSKESCHLGNVLGPAGAVVGVPLSRGEILAKEPVERRDNITAAAPAIWYAIVKSCTSIFEIGVR
jgi:hypothetical protein